MNKESFDFWNSWQNEIINGQNPIFPSNTSLKTNIKGGLGIWAGYGSDVVIVNTNISPFTNHHSPFPIHPNIPEHKFKI